MTPMTRVITSSASMRTGKPCQLYSFFEKARRKKPFRNALKTNVLRISYDLDHKNRLTARYHDKVKLSNDKENKEFTHYLLKDGGNIAGLSIFRHTTYSGNTIALTRCKILILPKPAFLTFLKNSIASKMELRCMLFRMCQQSSNTWNVWEVYIKYPLYKSLLY